MQEFTFDKVLVWDASTTNTGSRVACLYATVIPEGRVLFDLEPGNETTNTGATIPLRVDDLPSL